MMILITFDMRIAPLDIPNGRIHMATNRMAGRSWLDDLSISWPRPMTILGATLATLAIYLVATYAGNIDLTMDDGATTIGAIDVVLGTIVPGLGAWGLLAFLERRTGRAWTIWRAIAIAVLVLSLLGPFGADEQGGRVVLWVMHAVAGVIIIKGFSRTVKQP